MPIYDFTFSASAVGLPVTVKDDSDGTVVNTGTLSSTVYTLTLDEGQYTARAFDAASGLEYQAEGVIDVAASIANAPGAAETAYFVCTGPAFVTDGNGAAGTLIFEADARQGSLPSWASIDAGDIVLSDESGTCGFSVLGEFDFDFSATTPQGSGGNLYNNLIVKVDGVTLVSPTRATPGDGQDLQTSDPDHAGGLLVGTLVTCESFVQADNVTDGTATPRVALTITRLAPAPVLPA